VVLRGDGGGKAPARARALHGRNRVARTLRAWGRQLAKVPGATMRPATVNGGPGAVTYDPDGRVVSVLALDIADGQIQAISGIVNPDKLRHLGPVADVSGFLARLRGGG
jgi:RNA polymerase sigma-70 factor (ECF subfamily)